MLQGRQAAAGRAPPRPAPPTAAGAGSSRRLTGGCLSVCPLIHPTHTTNSHLQRGSPQAAAQPATQVQRTQCQQAPALATTVCPASSKMPMPPTLPCMRAQSQAQQLTALLVRTASADTLAWLRGVRQRRADTPNATALWSCEHAATSWTAACSHKHTRLMLFWSSVGSTDVPASGCSCMLLMH